MFNEDFEQEYEELDEEMTREMTEEESYVFEKLLYSFETDFVQISEVINNLDDYDIIMNVLDNTVEKGLISRQQAEEELTNTMIFLALEYYIMNELRPSMAICNKIIDNVESDVFVQFGDLMTMVDTLASWN